MLSADEIALLKEIGEQHLDELMDRSSEDRATGSDPVDSRSNRDGPAILGCTACGTPHGNEEVHFCTV